MPAKAVIWMLAIVTLLDYCVAGSSYCSCPDCINCANNDLVCGVDGVTYANICLAKCKPVKVDYRGACIVPTPTVPAQVANFDIVYTDAPDNDQDK